MANGLDILIWDDNEARVNSVYDKCHNYEIEAPLSPDDFSIQLTNQPKLVILNSSYHEDIILKILDQGLTRDGIVITFATEEYREHIVPKLKALSISTVGFDIDNQYLWISIYNIIRTNKEYENEQYFDCEVPEDFL